MSCEDRRSFEISDFQEDIVLNAIISTDLSWEVSLSYTKSIFDEADFTIIDDAEVRILNLSNGQSFFLDKKKSGNYCRELHPVEGHEYSIEVKIPEKEELRAITYVPSVLDVNVVSNLVEDEQGVEKIEINIEITDNPEEENYYVWELLQIDPQSFNEKEGNAVSTNSVGIEVIDPGLEDLNEEDGSSDDEPQLPDQKEVISPENIYSFNRVEDASNYQEKDFNVPSFFTDSKVASGKISNKLIFDRSFISEINSDYIFGDPGSNEQIIPLFELKVMAVSSDLYQYLRSYEFYKQNEIKNTSISDPVIIHSNIENGLGIFGGYNLKSFYIY